MIVESTENALSINGLKVLEPVKLFNNTSIECHLMRSLSMDMAKEVSCWIKKYVTVKNKRSIENVKYLLAISQAAGEPKQFIYKNTLATLNADHSIKFNIVGPVQASFLIALSIWIDSLDTNIKCEINGFESSQDLHIFKNEENKAAFAKTIPPLDAISLSKFIEFTNKEAMYIDLKSNVETNINPLAELTAKPQNTVVPFICTHKEIDENKKIKFTYFVYIQNEYVIDAILLADATISNIANKLKVNPKTGAPALMINYKFEEPVTYDIGQIIKITIPEELKQPSASPIETMTIRDAIAHLVELSEKRGLDSLVGISE